MRSRPSLLLMRNLRSLAVVVLATLPCVAFAQWRVVAVSTEVDKMRFNTIIGKRRLSTVWSRIQDPVT